MGEKGNKLVRFALAECESERRDAEEKLIEVAEGGGV